MLPGIYNRRVQSFKSNNSNKPDITGRLTSHMLKDKTLSAVRNKPQAICSTSPTKRLLVNEHLTPEMYKEHVCGKKKYNYVRVKNWSRLSRQI